MKDTVLSRLASFAEKQRCATMLKACHLRSNATRFKSTHIQEALALAEKRAGQDVITIDHYFEKQNEFRVWLYHVKWVLGWCSTPGARHPTKCPVCSFTHHNNATCLVPNNAIDWLSPLQAQMCPGCGKESGASLFQKVCQKMECWRSRPTLLHVRNLTLNP